MCTDYNMLNLPWIYPWGGSGRLYGRLKRDFANKIQFAYFKQEEEMAVRRSKEELIKALEDKHRKLKDQSSANELIMKKRFSRYT